MVASIYRFTGFSILLYYHYNEGAPRCTKGLLQPKHLSTGIQEEFLSIIITDKNDKLCQNRDTRNPRGIFR